MSPLTWFVVVPAFRLRRLRYLVPATVGINPPRGQEINLLALTGRRLLRPKHACLLDRPRGISRTVCLTATCSWCSCTADRHLWDFYTGHSSPKVRFRGSFFVFNGATSCVHAPRESLGYALRRSGRESVFIVFASSLFRRPPGLRAFEGSGHCLRQQLTTAARYRPRFLSGVGGRVFPAEPSVVSKKVLGCLVSFFKRAAVSSQRGGS